MKAIIITLCTTLLFYVGYSQQEARLRVIREIKDMAARYRTADHLKFDITYRYSSESSPGVYLDSLRGSFKLDQGRSWSVLDSTESIVDGANCVTLFKEDKIMYVSSSTTGLSSGGFLAIPDSILINNTAKVTIEESKEIRKLIIINQPGLSCKRTEYHISKSTGFVTRMLTVVTTSSMYDRSIMGEIEDGSYVMVEVDYCNYVERAFSDAEISMSKYYRKKGEEYVVVSPYDSYKIFIGSARF